MTHTRLNECLAILGWRPADLAGKLDMEERQTRRWSKGEYAIPDRVADWIERLAAFHLANPPPAKPRPKPRDV